MLNLLSGDVFFNIVGIITALVAVTIAYYKWRFTFWEKRGVVTLNPVIPWGDAKELMTGQVMVGEQFREFYFKFKKMNVKYGGVYIFGSPDFIPVDTELIKCIMQKDFSHFVNHGVFFNERDDPLTGHLFNIEGQKWRNLRVKLTPTFTTGKMKMMFSTLVNCTAGLKDIMEETVKSQTPLDIKEIMGRFATDIIGSAAFGLECNSLKDPNTPFRYYGKKFFENTLVDQVKFLLSFVFSRHVLTFFRMRVTKRDVEKFFMDVIRDTIEYREENNIYRKDFMHLLLQLKNRGVVADDEKIKDDVTDNSKSDEKLTFNEVAAQAFVFFVGGFETSSTLMTFTSYELATNPEIQDKLREEIRTVLAKHGGQLTYQCISEMSYMDEVLNETLRKYPPAPVLLRICNKEYQIPRTSTIIPKGTKVTISVYGIHHDPEYYPDPEKFDPERFTEENKAQRPHYTFLPFGEGPRICIGLRFGLLQSKVGLVTLLKDYRISLNEQTKQPLTLEKRGMVMSVEGGVWLNMKKI